MLCLYPMKLLRVKEVMEQKGVSRKDLANAVGISETAVSKIHSVAENPKEQYYPSIDVLKEIADYLKVDIRDLFNPTQEVNPVEKAKRLLSEAHEILNTI